MFIINDISFKNDEVIESKPVCLRTDNYDEIYFLGVLVEREIFEGKLEGKRYYQCVHFWGRSPVNFIQSDYKKLQQEYSFDINLEMVADFRYLYSDFNATPNLDNDVTQVSKSYRFTNS